MRHLHQFLVNNGNTGFPGRVDVVDIDFISVNKDLALFGDIDAAQHLDQR